MSVFPDARFLTSANQPAQFLPDEGVEVAFAGRSNAGKSSAINAIVNRRQLARTSKTPGRTQLINFFHLAPGQRLVDLPGYGYARVAPAVQAHWRELLVAYFRKRRSLRGLFIAVDIRRSVGELDLQMLDWCRPLAVPVHVLLTKADKLKRSEKSRSFAHAVESAGGGATVQIFSAEDGEGVAEARERLLGMLRDPPASKRRSAT
jgi:GTP-binding protein